MKTKLFLIMFWILGIQVNAQTTEIVADNIKYEIDVNNNTASVVGYIKYIEHANILKKVNEMYTVTSIGPESFFGCDSLSSMTLPNSITSIGEGAFVGCTSLASINLPYGITSIGEGAFVDCTSLASINLPNSITSIGEGAFSSCTSLSSITLPYSITSIGDWAFKDCTSLTSITLPNSITLIEGYAFSNCEKLTTIYCWAITPPRCYGDLFERCSSLQALHVPAGCKAKYELMFDWADYTIIDDLDSSAN